MSRSSAARALYYAAPFLICVAIHWLALKSWFRNDDFAWLGLRLEIHSWRDLFAVLFQPRAQGTVRTISERLYFLAFSSVFGLNAAAFRAWAFLTQFASIALLMSVTRRLTRSALAAFLAPVFWCANAGLAESMSWSSAYNEICCGFFLLFAFYLALRYFDTGRTVFWIAQWFVFCLGFGALELVVMYPAVIACYAWCARKHFLKTLPLFVPSILFTVAHFLYVPRSQSPQYWMHFDSSMLTTLWRYWAFALAAARPDVIDWRPVWLGLAVAVVLTAVLFAFAARHLRPGVFLLAWFVLILLPVLPLRDHFTEYYITVPAAGLAALGAWAFADAWFSPRRAARIPAILLAGLYVTLSLSDLHIAEKYFYDRAHSMKRLVLGLARRQNADAGKAVLLTGITDDVFWAGFFDDPFRLIGLREVYLAPGSEKGIDAHPEWGGVARFQIAPDAALAALENHEAVVYAFNGSQLQNVTAAYEAVAKTRFGPPRHDRLDAGKALQAGLLGPGWYPLENGFRWMAASASIELSGPREGGESLYLTGYCPDVALSRGPIVLTVSADGHELGRQTVTQPNHSFEAHFALPDSAVGKTKMTITLSVDHTYSPPEAPRPLGLIFGTFSIH